MRRLTDPHPVPVTWLGPVRLVSLAAAMLAGPALLTFGPDSDGGLAVIATGTVLLSLLVLARLVGLVGMLARDVAQRRALEAQLSFQAFHDPLTGLTNRRRFMKDTEAALAQRSAPGTVAALFLDLDDFKTINDTLGHAAGDEALVEVSNRLRTTLRGSDVAARLGGDEFGILLRDLPDEGRAIEVAERLLVAVSKPLLISDDAVKTGASIGIAIDSPEMQTVDDLLNDADVAMYRAKAQGKAATMSSAPMTRLPARTTRAGSSVARRSADASRCGLPNPAWNPGPARLVATVAGCRPGPSRRARMHRWRSRSSRCTPSSAPASSCPCTSSRSATGP